MSQRLRRRLEEGNYMFFSVLVKRRMCQTRLGPSKAAENPFEVLFLDLQLSQCRAAGRMGNQHA